MNPLSGVLSEAWEMYKTYARHLLAIAFVIYVVAAIVAGLLSWAAACSGRCSARSWTSCGLPAPGDARQSGAGRRRRPRRHVHRRDGVRGHSVHLGRRRGVDPGRNRDRDRAGVLVIAPGLYLITIWAVIVPVIVIERSGALAAFGRSRQLVRGRGLHVFATLVLVYVILLSSTSSSALSSRLCRTCWAADSARSSPAC